MTFWIYFPIVLMQTIALYFLGRALNANHEAVLTKIAWAIEKGSQMMPIGFV